MVAWVVAQKTTLGVENHFRFQLQKLTDPCAIPHPPCCYSLYETNCLYYPLKRSLSSIHSILTSLSLYFKDKLPSHSPATLRTQSFLIHLIRSTTRFPEYRTNEGRCCQEVRRNAGYTS